MAKAKRTDQKDSNLIINQLTISQLRRNAADIQSWKTAVQAAESITSPNRRALYELYQNVLADGFLAEQCNKRIRAITNTPCYFIQKDGTINNETNKLFETSWFINTLKHIVDALFWGHSLLEFEKEPNTGLINKTILTPRQNVSPEKGFALRFAGDSTGIPFRELPYNNFVLEVGTPRDLGLLLQASIYVLYKRGAIGDWAQFCEIFGMPIRQFTYNPHDPESRQQAKQAAEAAGAAAYIIIPDGVKLELHKGAEGANSSAVYNDLRKAMNEEISITILGQTLTSTQGDSGARSLGEVHENVQEQIHKEDRLFVTYLLNEKFIAILRNLGYPLPEGGYFSFDTSQQISIEKRLDMDLKIHSQFPIEPDYFYEEYKVPKAKGESKEQRVKNKDENPEPKNSNLVKKKVKSETLVFQRKA